MHPKKYTFQRAMEVAFEKLIDDILVVFQDDLTASSKKVEDHCKHLDNIFLRALEYGISINPKKCRFGVTKGKFLGCNINK